MRKMLAMEMAPTTLADCVENQLLNFMHRNNLKPGDTLPREEELATYLNVSRHIVREGISRLKALDLVESRKRKGLVMKAPHAFSGLKKLADVNLLPPESKQEFREIRYALEIGLCDFIYMRKSPEKLKELRKYAGCVAPYNYTKEQEIEFHTCLTGIAGNRQVVQFRVILESFFSGTEHPAEIKVTPSTHLEICEALESGTLEEFRQVMHQHFMNDIVRMH